MIAPTVKLNHSLEEVLITETIWNNEEENARETIKKLKWRFAINLIPKKIFSYNNDFRFASQKYKFLGIWMK